MSAILSWVSAMEGCLLREVPLYNGSKFAEIVLCIFTTHTIVANNIAALCALESGNKQ